jgi:signal transduction histidine kinase
VNGRRRITDHQLTAAALVVVAAAVVAELARPTALQGTIGPVAVIGLVIAHLAAMARITRPGVALGAATVGQVVAAAAGFWFAPLALGLVIYEIPLRWRHLPRLVPVALAAPVAVSAAVAVPGGLDTASTHVAVLLAAVAVGERRRARCAESEALERLAADVEERDLVDRRVAQAEERLRLARELNESVGGLLGGLVIQARSVRQMLTTDRQRASGMVARMEEASEETLQEIKMLTALLRSEDSSSEMARIEVDRSYSDGVDAVDVVADRYRGKGMDVTLGAIDRRHRTGSAGALPIRLWSAIERIVDDAMANVVGHAGLVGTDVRLELTDDAVVVRVTNPVTSELPVDYSSRGLGLRGMRERVLLAGGSLQAGPTGLGTFEVEARFGRDRPARAA